MKIPTFTSALAPFLHDLVALRLSLGYDDGVLICHLARFDRYLASQGRMATHLTREFVEEWLRAEGPLKPRAEARRLHAMRILGRFIAQTRPETYIPGPSWIAHQASSFRPHIYTSNEIRLLLAEASRLGPSCSFRPYTYRTLISLLYCTGLRISEALGLQLASVDLDKGVLVILESKFHKSRLVPLHPETTAALRLYRKEREARGHRQNGESQFFVSDTNRPLRQRAVSGTFLSIARRVGIRGGPGTRGPRIHDFRHSFAVHRLMAWYKDGGDVQSRLPLLSTYLGHVSIISTQVYLDVTSELLQEAARRFKAPCQPIANEEGAHA